MQLCLGLTAHHTFRAQLFWCHSWASPIDTLEGLAPHLAVLVSLTAPLPRCEVRTFVLVVLHRKKEAAALPSPSGGVSVVGLIFKLSVNVNMLVRGHQQRVKQHADARSHAHPCTVSGGPREVSDADG